MDIFLNRSKMICSSADDHQDQKTMAFDDDRDLPHDVVVEILARLLKKSLARFNCVSREWKHTLSHRWFQDLRRDCKRSKRRRQPKWIMRMSQRRVRGCWELCCQMTHTDTEEQAGNNNTLIKEFTLPPFYNEPGFAGDSPCRSDNLLFYYSDEDLKPYLYDIQTDKIQQLPEASRHTRISDFVYGFGYSSKGDEYKVVHLYRTETNAMMMSCKVYSTRSNSWTRISERCPCSAIGSIGGGVVAYDKIHWKPAGNSCVTFSVVSFDLNEEKFTTMPFSRECEFDSELYEDGYLAELKGRLCLVHHPMYCEEDIRLRVLAVKDYGRGTWEYLCNIRLDFMNREPPSPIFFTIYQVAYVGNQELAFAVRFGKYDIREVYCDMKESVVTRVVDKAAYGTTMIYGKTRKV